MFARFDVRATIGVGNSVERGFAELVSGDYFRTLGVGAALGRTLGPEDDRVPGAHPVVVLTHAHWQRRFGGDAGVLGRDIRINGHVMTIVGVAQPGFNGVDLGAPVDLFVPLLMKPALTPTWNDLENWRSRWVTVMGRLAPGVSRDQRGRGAERALSATAAGGRADGAPGGQRARTVSSQESAGDRGRKREVGLPRSVRAAARRRDGHGRPRADRRLRQRRQSDAGESGRASEGRRAAAGAGRGPMADRASAAGGERRARGGWHAGGAADRVVDDEAADPDAAVRAGGARVVVGSGYQGRALRAWRRGRDGAAVRPRAGAAGAERRRR